MLTHISSPGELDFFFFMEMAQFEKCNYFFLSCKSKVRDISAGGLAGSLSAADAVKAAVATACCCFVLV